MMGLSLSIPEGKEYDPIKAAADVAQLMEHHRKRLDRAIELYDLEQAGRLVVLPCKVGDTVFVINRHLNAVFESSVISMGIGRSTDLKNYIKTKWVGTKGNESIRKWSFRQVGRYVFLTREEAEAALKGADNG